MFEHARRWRSPEAPPFLPLVLSAWSDGLLTADEITTLGAFVEARTWIGSGTRDGVVAWLDPATPPGFFETAKSRAIRAQVNALYREVRELTPAVVDAFGIPESVLAAPAALSKGS